jgi:hypothetical protein
VLTTRPLPAASGFAPAASGSTEGSQSPLDSGVDTTIDPAAMPAGTELFFDYVPGDNLIAPNLIYSNAYTCSAGPPPLGPKS